MNNYRRSNKRSPWASAVDSAVADFTKNVLGIANKANVPFEYAGNKGNQSQEINRTMRINTDVVKDLLSKHGL